MVGSLSRQSQSAVVSRRRRPTTADSDCRLRLSTPTVDSDSRLTTTDYRLTDSFLRLRRRLIEPHAEAQTHARQDLFDLVQRLPAEVLRLQHLPFGLLHELADGSDIRVLQAVVRPHGELQLLDALVEVLVERRARLVGRGVLLQIADLLEVDEDVQVIANQLRGQRDRVARADRVSSRD